MSTPKSPRKDAAPSVGAPTTPAAQDREKVGSNGLATVANGEAGPVNRPAKKDSLHGANGAGDVKKEGENPHKHNARARRMDWQEPYLAKLAETGQVTVAAEEANVSRSIVAEHRRRDAAFADAEATAFAESRHAIESEAVKRAFAGSDAIMLRLLERMETGSWRQRQQIEHGAPGQFATRAERKAALAKAREEAAASTQRGAEAARPLSLPSKN